MASPPKTNRQGMVPHGGAADIHSSGGTWLNTVVRVSYSVDAFLLDTEGG